LCNDDTGIEPPGEAQLKARANFDAVEIADISRDHGAAWRRYMTEAESCDLLGGPMLG